MKLNDKQREILCAAHLTPELSYAELGKRSGYPASTVRHTLKRLEALGMIYKRPKIHYGCLGYNTVQIYFSYYSQDPQAEQTLTEYLLAQPSVSACYTLGGEYQYGILLQVANLADVKTFIIDLQKHSGIQITEKVIGIVLSVYLFRRDYLAEIPEGPRELVSRNNVVQQEFNDVEKEILRGLTQLPYTSRRALARALKINQSTFEYHLKKLIEKGVYGGMVYSLRERLMGISQYRLLLYARSPDAALSEQLLTISREHPNVLAFYEGLGAWDYEIEVESEDPNVAVRLRQELLARLGNKIVYAHLHQLFQYHKASNKPVYEDY